jgi:hypothetical protein
MSAVKFNMIIQNNILAAIVYDYTLGPVNAKGNYNT